MKVYIIQNYFRNNKLFFKQSIFTVIDYEKLALHLTNKSKGNVNQTFSLELSHLLITNFINRKRNPVKEVKQILFIIDEFDIFKLNFLP